MFAIAFDMVMADLAANYTGGHPTNAYYDIRTVMAQYDFFNAQGSLYLTMNDDMANLFAVMNALKSIPWFAASVRDIRAFRVENWSDFTQFMKGTVNGGNAQGANKSKGII